MSVRDVEGQDGDMFAMEVNASMIDYTIRMSDRSFFESTMPKDDNECKEDYQKRAMTEAHEFCCGRFTSRFRSSKTS